MHRPSIKNRFIGREQEIARFRDWLDDASTPPILYFHDATDDPEGKGGIGKTYLLRYCADLALQRQDVAVVTADFFHVGDRDSVFLAETILNGLQRLFPDWTPEAFQSVLSRWRAETLSADEGTLQLQRLLTSELARDLQRLEIPVPAPKTLLVFLDTFEMIEHNPDLVVLRPGQTFPDTYHIPCIRFVIAGRNRLDPAHRNWQGREREVADIPLEPFDRREMMEYMEAEVITRIPTEEQQITILYEHTAGRPILIGLTTDVLNHRILTLEALLSVQRPAFEQYLVEQINYLENPLNWVILSMAHVSHRFHLSMLEHILKHVELTEAVQEISQEVLSATLPQLSFVRQVGTGQGFVLHDETQRLVTRYCWPKHDTDGRVRKAISRCMIEYYEKELLNPRNDQESQATTIELLYHTLYVDLDGGLIYFKERIGGAMQLWQLNFARLLFLEVQKFRPAMSLAQQNVLQLQEARLLRTEENPASIRTIEALGKQADPAWMELNRTDFLFEAGRCYFEQGLLKDARLYFMQALETAQENERLKAFILSFLGGTSRKQGQFAEAVHFFEQSTAILKNLGIIFSYANGLNMIGTILSQQGKYEEAMLCCKIALQIRRELFADKQASEIPIGHSLVSLGVTYLRDGNIIEAERFFKQAFEIYTRTNHRVGIATLYNHFGNVGLRRGNIEEAQSWFLKGEQASASISTEQYIICSNKLGRVRLEQGRIQEAVVYLQRAITVARAFPNYFQLTKSLIDLARVFRRMEKNGEAEALLREAEEIAEREFYPGLYASIDLIRAEKALQRGDNREAFRSFEFYCYHAALRPRSEYNIAVRRTFDALLTIPMAEQSAMIEQLIQSWTARGLGESYPELIDACKKVQELRIG